MFCPAVKYWPAGRKAHPLGQGSLLWREHYQESPLLHCQQSNLTCKRASLQRIFTGRLIQRKVVFHICGLKCLPSISLKTLLFYSLSTQSCHLPNWTIGPSCSALSTRNAHSVSPGFFSAPVSWRCQRLIWGLLHAKHVVFLLPLWPLPSHVFSVKIFPVQHLPPSLLSERLSAMWLCFGIRMGWISKIWGYKISWAVIRISRTSHLQEACRTQPANSTLRRGCQGNTYRVQQSCSTMVWARCSIGYEMKRRLLPETKGRKPYTTPGNAEITDNSVPRIPGLVRFNA